MACNSITVDKHAYEALQQEVKQLRQVVAGSLQAECSTVLKYSEERFARMADNVPGVIYQFQVKVDGTVSFPYVSSGSRELFELEPEQVYENSNLLFEMVHPEDLPGLQETIAISTQTLQNWKYEWRCFTPSGKQKWLKGISKPQPQLDNSILWDGCIVDISDRKLAEQALQTLNEQLEAKFQERTAALNQKTSELEAMFNAFPDLFFRLAADSTILDYKTSYRDEQLYVSPEVFLGKRMVSILPASVAELLQQGITQVKQSSSLVSIEYSLQMPTGEEYYEGRLVPFANEQMILIVRNVSERKRAEEALLESEQRLRTVIASAPIVLFSLDRHGRFTLSEGKGLAALGLKPGQVVGTSIYELYQDFPDILSLINSVLAGEEIDGITEVAGVVFENRYRPIRDQAGEVTGMIGVAVDVTERKLASAQLKEQEQFVRTIYDGVAQAIFVIDVLENGEFRYVGWNWVAEQLTKISSADANGKTPEDVFGNVQGAAVRQRYKSCVEAGITMTYEECLTFHSQQSWWLTTINPLKDSQGRIYRLVATKFNITKRKQAEEALEASQHFIERITYSSPNTIYIYDLEKQCNIYANHELTTVLGYSVEHIQKLGAELLPTIIHPDDNEKLLSHFQKLTTLKDGEIFELEYRMRRADGECCWLFSRDTPFSRNASGSVNQILGVATDITARKLAEIKLQQQTQDLENTLRQLQHTQAQLIQSEKMSSLGQMVAGVAHEINNPVNFIHGNIIPACEYIKDLLQLVELYQQHFPEPPEEIEAQIEDIDLDFLKSDLIKILSSMEVGTERIREIVLSLRNFSRLDEAEFKRVDIHEGIDSTLMILHNRLKAKPNLPEISVIKEYEELPRVECFPGQLNQVFMNILVNGIDALESFVTCEPSLTPEIRIHTEVIDNNWIAIKISDNGCGIPEEILSKLFDPFFTTKDVGKGTGLGLSICYQIVVDKHHGKLSCNSTLGLGAEFVIEIPISHPEA